MSSAMVDLICSRCAAAYDADVPQHRCPIDGGPLLVRYDLDAARKGMTPAALAKRAPSFWRYEELLPVRDASLRVSLGESLTPILAMPRLGRSVAIPRLMMKDEGLLPTGSFKARGAAVGVTRLRELGVAAFGMPTNGNAGSAWAAYAARAGIAAHVVMPRTSPPSNRFEAIMTGADVALVDGTIADAGAIVGRTAVESDLYDASTLKEPYRVEGKKTIGFEIAEQCNWELPDVIIYPTGGGVGLIGMEKAFRELQAIGLLGPKMPRFVAAQADGCQPIVEAWRDGRDESTAAVRPRTVAFGLTVPKPLGDFLIMRILRETNGCAVAVSDEALLAWQRAIGAEEGLFACPEGGATLAAAVTLRAQNWIAEDERVLLVNTGLGVKYAVPYDAPPTIPIGGAIAFASDAAGMRG
jgi:threonine synthase